MKVIKFNKENVKEEEIERKVSKSRAIILNEQGKALIVKYAGLYMFPGGRIEQETPREAVIREVQEEAGIFEVEFEDEPFLKIKSYDRNYYTRRLGRNITRLTQTYFYFGKTKEDINLKRRNLSQDERKSEFLISFENLSIIRYFAETNQTSNEKLNYFNRELFIAMQEFTKYQKEKVKEIQR